MCGIGGWFSWSDHRPPVDLVKNLLLANQTRGRSAAGIAYLKGGQIMYRKNKGPAEELIASIDESEGVTAWEEIVASPRGIIHARATTKGSEKDNVNNHPVIGNGWAVVHNGHVNNDDELFAFFKKPRFAEVDSAAISLVLGEGRSIDESIKHLTVLSGNATISAWNLEQTDNIVLARLGYNDLYMFYLPEVSMMLWSSAACFYSSLPAKKIGALRFMNVARLADNRVMVLTPEQDSIRSFEVTRRPFVRGRFGTHRATVATEAPKSAEKAVTVAGSVVGPVSPSAVPKNAGAVGRFKWERPDARATGSERPAPDFSQLIGHSMYDWHHWDLARRMQLFKETSTLFTVTVHTPYGRWCLYNPDGVGSALQNRDRNFLPRGSFKKWLKDKYGHEWPDVKPGMRAEMLDNHLELESVMIGTINPGTAGEFQTFGHMCPWCGAMARIDKWAERFYRCNWCDIKSRKPGIVEVEGVA